MVVTVAAENAQQQQGGLRSMDPTRDLRAIADLVAAGFADELDERGQAAIREMRWMATMSPLVWWWSRADPTFSDAFNGFVWEEPSAKGTGKGKRKCLPVGKHLCIVGNVSLNRAPGARKRWVICNVVVTDEYRGHGIARQLVETAIDAAEDMGAEGLVLQVYEDNLPALHLSRTLGFHEVSGECGLRLNAIRAEAILDAPGYGIRAWRPSDGKATHQLAQLVTPSIQQWLRPVKAHDHRPGWLARQGKRVTDLLAGRRAYRLAMFKEDRLVATMAITAALRGGEHRLSLLVHPDHAGQVEPALISRALHALAAIPPRPAVATALKEHAAALQVLRDCGFEERRTLLTMSKNF